MKMLVVIDYQKDFVDGSLGFEKAKDLEPLICDRILQGINDDEYVVLTMDTHGPDYLDTREGKALPVEHCITGTPGWELYGNVRDIAKNNKLLMVAKHTFGVSPNVMLDLPKEDVDEIEICGIITNMCVISNVAVFQAMYPNTQIYVNENLCASNDPELHKKAIDVMESMQVKIIR